MGRDRLRSVYDERGLLARGGAHRRRQPLVAAYHAAGNLPRHAGSGRAHPERQGGHDPLYRRRRADAAAAGLYPGRTDD